MKFSSDSALLFADVGTAGCVTVHCGKFCTYETSKTGLAKFAAKLIKNFCVMSCMLVLSCLVADTALFIQSHDYLLHSYPNSVSINAIIRSSCLFLF